MQLLPIDDHVPLPTPWHDSVEIDIVTHTLWALNVGQSFAVPADKRPHRVRALIANVQKGGGHFASHTAAMSAHSATLAAVVGQLTTLQQAVGTLVADVAAI